MAARSAEVRERVRLHAENRCVYCHAPQSLIYCSHEFDHIIPPGAGGTDDEVNLCLACSDCNLYKSNRTAAIDPQTGELAALLHPRNQAWNEHFRWDASGTKVTGVSPTGRATIALLRMNADSKIGIRQMWVAFGRFPPDADLAD